MSSKHLVLLLLASAVAAAPPFDARAPGRVLPVGQPVVGALQVSAAHVYRVEVPVTGGRGESLSAALHCGDTQLQFWPRWHGSNALRPRDTIVGYVVMPPGIAGPAAVMTRGPEQVRFGEPRFTDLGILPSDPPAVLWVAPMTPLVDDVRPAGFDSVAFAKPGQLVATRQGLRNREGRAMLFGEAVPARFGEILRLTVRVHGKGKVRLALVPYVAGRQRGVAACWHEFHADHEWRTALLVAGPHIPQADTVRPMIECWGDTTLANARLERLAVGE